MASLVIPPFSLYLYLFLFLLLLLLSDLGTCSLGGNYLEYSNSNPVLTTPRPFTSSITVSGFPVSTFSLNVAMSLTISMTDGDPSTLIVILYGPNDQGVVLGYYQSVSACPGFYTTTVMDSLPLQLVAGSSSGSAACPPANFTALGDYSYQGTMQMTMTQTQTPFSTVFYNQPINGEWTLNIQSNLVTDSGTLTSWSLRFYCEWSHFWKESWKRLDVGGNQLPNLSPPSLPMCSWLRRRSMWFLGHLHPQRCFVFVRVPGWVHVRRGELHRSG